MKTVALMSLGLPLATMPAVAQDDEGELTPVVITGSNIPTVELEGPSPLVRLDREELHRAGAANQSKPGNPSNQLDLWKIFESNFELSDQCFREKPS